MPLFWLCWTSQALPMNSAASFLIMSRPLEYQGQASSQVLWAIGPVNPHSLTLCGGGFGGKAFASGQDWSRPDLVGEQTFGSIVALCGLIEDGKIFANP